MKDRPYVLVGIDPGLTTSHAVAIACNGVGQHYSLRALAELRTPTDVRRVYHPEEYDLKAVASIKPDAVLVEVARGGIASGRDGDPILHCNVVAGMILGRLHMLGILAVPVASGGDVTAWNWRTELGIRGKGAAARDAAVEMAVSAYLEGSPLPTGPRGGKLTHWQDAAGIALAGFSRVYSTAPHIPLQDALTVPTYMDEVRLAKRKSRKVAGMAARAGKREWLS